VIYRRGKTTCALCGKVMHTRWNYYRITHAGRTVIVHGVCSHGYLLRQGLPFSYPMEYSVRPR